MDINSLLNNQSEKSFIQKDVDPKKYDEIAGKLCDKRRVIEKILENKDIDQTTREDNALELIQIKKDLTLFGITEIDYQAYIANKERDSHTS
jgi:hypothetical protein